MGLLILLEVMLTRLEKHIEEKDAQDGVEVVCATDGGSEAAASADAEAAASAERDDIALTTIAHGLYSSGVKTLQTAIGLVCAGAFAAAITLTIEAETDTGGTFVAQLAFALITGIIFFLL